MSGMEIREVCISYELVSISWQLSCEDLPDGQGITRCIIVKQIEDFAVNVHSAFIPNFAAAIDDSLQCFVADQILGK